MLVITITESKEFKSNWLVYLILTSLDQQKFIKALCHPSTIKALRLI